MVIDADAETVLDKLARLDELAEEMEKDAERFRQSAAKFAVLARKIRAAVGMTRQ